MSRRSGYVGPIAVRASQAEHQQANAARQQRLEREYDEAHAVAERARAAAQRSAAAVAAAPRVSPAPAPVKTAPAAAQPSAVPTRVVAEAEYKLLIRAADAYLKRI